jgi:hypothetical protein
VSNYNCENIPSSYDASLTNNFNPLYNYYYPVSNAQPFQANFSYIPTTYTSYSNENCAYYNQYQFHGYPFSSNSTLDSNAFNFENALTRVVPNNPSDTIQLQQANQTKIIDSIQFGIFNQNELKLALKDIDLLPDELLN